MATTATGIEAARELDELYRSHAPEVFRYAYAVLGNRADAEDITQTTFVNAMRALERGERPRTPKNWLITIAHNLIRQRFRQLQARPREVELDHDLPAAEAADEGPSIDDLVRALQRIPPTQRQALVLRELEGRSYNEIGELLGVSQSALETLIFRARRSLAEELENLVTCDAAELALSRATDGRLGRKERRRLLAHLDECTSCARIAARGIKRRRAFKALAVLPLPFSLTLFKGAPSASAAAGLPTIGVGVGATAGTATGVGAAGVGSKIALGLAAVAVAGGAGYEGAQVVRDAAPPPRAAAKTAPATAVSAARPVVADRAAPNPVKLVLSKPTPRRAAATPKPARLKSKLAQAATPVKGRSAAAPGHTKTATATPAKTMPPTSRGAAAGPRPKSSRGVGPAVERAAGKSATAPGRRPSRTAKPKKAAKPAKPQPKAAASPKPEAAAKPEKPGKPLPTPPNPARRVS